MSLAILKLSPYLQHKTKQHEKDNLNTFNSCRHSVQQL
jgi:hypothetical protein